MIKFNLQLFGCRGSGGGKGGAGSGGSVSKAAVELKDAVDYLNALYQTRAWRETKGRDTKGIDQEIAELRAEITKLRHKSNI